MKAKHSPAPWNVRPDYGKENVYRLWDEDSNYHADTSPEAMDANARLISAAPDLLSAAMDALESLKRLKDADGAYRVTNISQLQTAIKKAIG